MSDFDILMAGHISKDIMVHAGVEERLLGGAVVYSSAAAARSGASVLVVTKASPADRHLLDAAKVDGASYSVIDSPETTSIRNVYLSEDRERRDVTLLTQADPFTPADIPDVPAKVLHLAGLFHGELPVSLIPELAGRYPLAVDAQGLLRRNDNGRLLFRDLEEKRDILPRITWLKTDAAEAEILTGETDRERAAHMLHEMGAKEVMVTHNAEVIVLHDGRLYRAPFTARNLSGRTGRGDTCFASYLAWRLSHGPDESVRYAAALTSIKMETPGAFRGTVQDVRERLLSFYS